MKSHAVKSLLQKYTLLPDLKLTCLSLKAFPNLQEEMIIKVANMTWSRFKHIYSNKQEVKTYLYTSRTILTAYTNPVRSKNARGAL